MSYTSSLYHVIFSTYRREPSIVNEYREKLYGVMANIIMANNSRALIINGTPDHVHLLMFLNPSVSPIMNLRPVMEIDCCCFPRLGIHNLDCSHLSEVFPGNDIPTPYLAVNFGIIASFSARYGA